MRLAILLASGLALLPTATMAQMDPGAVAAGEAVRYDNERRAREARGEPAQSPQGDYEQ